MFSCQKVFTRLLVCTKIEVDFFFLKRINILANQMISGNSKGDNTHTSCGLALLQVIVMDNRYGYSTFMASHDMYGRNFSFTIHIVLGILNKKILKCS